MGHVKRINFLLFLIVAFSLFFIGWVDLVWWQKVVLIFVILIVYSYVIIKGLKMRKTELQLEELESTKQKIFDRASGSFRHMVETGGRYLYILRTGGRAAKCETEGMVAGGDEGRIFRF